MNTISRTKESTTVSTYNYLNIYKLQSLDLILVNLKLSNLRVSETMMALQWQHCYFGVLMLGMLLMTLTFRFYSTPKITQIYFDFGINPIFNQSSNPQVMGKELVNYPWISDPTCQHFAVQFAKMKTRPKWALTSFPGSGVTWTRQLIEGVTGIYTGTVYTDEPQILDGNHHGNEAEIDCECTIVIKDHGYPEVYPYVGTEGPYENRAILLLRNPFDALFTFGHYLFSGSNQSGIVSEDVFTGKAWEDHFKYVAYEWAEHADRWIKNIKNGTVIFYELLMHETESELNRLLRAINFIDPHHPSVDPERMRCTLKHKNRSDRKRSSKPKIPLTSEQHTKLMESIKKVQESLRQKGWPLLPVHLYNLYGAFEYKQNDRKRIIKFNK